MSLDQPHDILLTVGSVRARGIWVAELKTGRFPARRTAGRINQNASHHSLLAVAVLASLRSVSAKIAAGLAQESSRRKPSVLIASEDETFIGGLAKLKRSSSMYLTMGCDLWVRCADRS